MSMGSYNLKKTLKLFAISSEELMARGLEEEDVAQLALLHTEAKAPRSWSVESLPAIGKKIGFLPRLKAPLAISVFVTKGGVLKTTLTLNIARLAALHGLRVCVVGLDMQGDVTSNLSSNDLDENTESLEAALAKIDSEQGLADVFNGSASLSDVICATDIPTLFYIPETPELVSLDQGLINRNRREYWLQEHVVEPLKENFDLVIMDCSPNWNRLITNALVACDALISPLECKINNFRNFKIFRALISEFRQDMRAEFRHIYVPTKVAPQRKLSREIFEWYQANLNDCTSLGIRESVQGEESVALKLSASEYAPNSQAAAEMRELTKEIWNYLIQLQTTKEQSKTHESTENGSRRTELFS